MGRLNEKVHVVRFMENLFWLNLKKLKMDILWRVLLVISNFMLLFSAVMGVEFYTVMYILTLVSMSNVLFMYTRAESKLDAIALLRSLGASKTFVIADNLVEIMLEYLIACILVLVILPFQKMFPYLFLVMLIEFLLITIVSPIFSFLTINRLEKQRKKL